jgi:polygalacturonase
MVRFSLAVAVGLVVFGLVGFVGADEGATEPSAGAGDVVAALPVIPDKTFNLSDYGSVGDGETFNTDAFKKAVAAVGRQGAGI